jgi:hypothetical protein
LFQLKIQAAEDQQQQQPAIDDTSSATGSLGTNDKKQILPAKE